MEIAVEVFEQGQKRSFIRRYSADSISVGRGWDNDIIIRDPLLDAHHLQISSDAEGRVLVEDRNSTNGTRIGRNRLGQPTTVEFGQLINLGHSQIRLHRTDQQVPPALKVGRLDEVVDWFRAPAVAIGLAVLAVIAGVASNWLGDPTQTSWNERASQALMLAVGLLCWAIVWGAIARLLRHEMAVWPHLSLVSLVLLLGAGGYWMIEWIAFNSLSVWLSEGLMGLCIALVLFATLLVGLNITTRLPLRYMAGVSGAIVFVAISILYLLPALEEEQSQQAPEMIIMTKRPGLLVAGSESIDSFLSQSDSLFERLDEMRAQDDPPADEGEQG